MIPITVFTPTYNRRDLLLRCYESLIRQSCHNFIWMIIDDGSTDNTNEVVKAWTHENRFFEIQYYYKKNGGLHTAYNEAISHIHTPLCVCIDSDDWMPDDAIEHILDFWNKYGSSEFAGMVGLDCYSSGKIVGDPLPEKKTINLIDLLVGRYSINNGDRTNVVRTELYKSVAPMKVFQGEKYFNPHYMHLQISQKYDFLVMNEALRIVEYQSGGMSDSMLHQYKNSPNSFAEIRKLYLSFPNTSLFFRFRHTVHLVSSCILSGNLMKAFSYGSSKLMTIFALPEGLLLSLIVVLKG